MKSVDEITTSQLVPFDEGTKETARTPEMTQPLPPPLEKKRELSLRAPWTRLEEDETVSSRTMPLILGGVLVLSLVLAGGFAVSHHSQPKVAHKLNVPVRTSRR